MVQSLRLKVHLGSMKGHPGLFAPRSMLLATPRVEYSYSLVHYLRKCYDRNRANTKLTFDD